MIKTKIRVISVGIRSLDDFIKLSFNKKKKKIQNNLKATGAIEAFNAKKTGKLIQLSEQNLIDCSLKYGKYNIIIYICYLTL